MLRLLPQRKSAVLVLALLLMGAIIGSGLSLSTVISDNSHQSQAITDFISASLTADSGIERALAVVKNGRQGGSNLNSTVSNAQTSTIIPGATITATSPSLNTGQIGWNVVRPNQSVSFDLSKSGSDISQFTITVKWNRVDGTYTNGGPQTILGRALLDISWLGLDANGQPFYTGKTTLSTSQPSNTATVDLLSAGFLYNITGQRLSSASQPTIQLGQTQGFRIRIRPIDRQPKYDIDSYPSSNPAELAKLNLDIDSVKQLRVSGTATFPARVDITSTGKFSQSQSQKQASVLWQLPSSPAFSYVLFTESDIIPE